MKCRIDIVGRKIWNDGNNAYDTRPQTVTINLLRDGELYKSTTIDAFGSGKYRFPCLLRHDSTGREYVYQIEEPQVSTEYTVVVNGYNVVNTLNQITVSGVKTWNDRNNIAGNRPASITVLLLQNGVLFRSLVLDSPPDTEDTAVFTFDNLPFADAQGIPFVYTVDEEPVEHYTKTISGFNVINSEGIEP